MTGALAFTVATTPDSLGVGVSHDPARSSVRRLSLYGYTPSLGNVACVYDIVDYFDEAALLGAVSRLLSHIAADRPVLVGWHPITVDVPYLAYRYQAVGIGDKGPAGGGDRGMASWQGIEIYDVACDYVHQVEIADVGDDLRSVAASVGLAPDTGGRSDAHLIYDLYARVHLLRPLTVASA